MTGARRFEAPAWVLFDGRCGLCDRTVRWLIARDRRGALRFAPLEGTTAAAVRGRHRDLPPADETLVLVEAPETDQESVLVRSRALAGILARLGSPWRSLAWALRLLPSALLDRAYRFVARRRRRWFGRLEACRVPTPSERERFLESAAGTDGARPSGNIPPP